MIYNFNNKNVPTLSQVGGKAKALIETTLAGFKVPEGLVLSVEFFKYWDKKLHELTEWQDFILDPSKKSCDALKETVSQFRFSEEQIHRLAKSLDDYSEDAIFAVRSSSPEEDLVGNSFAGQYETYLGIQREQLEETILRVYMSMLDFRVVEYKKLNGISLKNPHIAVIIQRQISSDISGIAFSLNPHNNAYDEALINASFGLGESIVSGQVTPDSYVVDKVKEVIMDKKINHKEVGLWLKKDGGVTETKLHNSDKQALTDSQILQVAMLARSCEEHYGVPMDIEWAIEGGELYLLQSRPITTYLKLYDELMTKPGEQKKLYLDLIVMTQGFEEPFSVLGLDIWSGMLEYAKMGLCPVGPDGVIYNVHGRQYMHLSNMMKGYGKKITKQMLGRYEKPLKKIMEDMDFTEYMPAKKPEKIKGLLKNTIKVMFISVGGMRKGMKDPEGSARIYEKASAETFKYYKEELISNRPFGDLVEDGLLQFRDMVQGIITMGGAHMAIAKINKMFKGHEIEELVVALGMDLPGNPTSRMGHLMLKIANYEEIQETASEAEFIDKINRSAYSVELMRDYHEYMSRYGCRGFKEIDIVTPRISERPEDFFKQLKSLNIQHNNLKDVKKRREDSYNKLLEMARELGKEKQFIRYSNIYTKLLGYREDPKYLYVVLVGELRKRALQLGKQFVKQGRLDKVHHIFDLNIEQVTRGEADSSVDLRQLREENIKPRRAMENVKGWPKLLDSRGKIYRYVRESSDGDLVGEPISPGIIRGKAKVLSSPYEKQIHEGEILVTRATEPSWTPVFANAAGVVLEIGGPLQHGAIIAREYGIPCVSGIHNATTAIKDGDLIEVDGASGIVKIIE